jgi:hypothetical protein
VTVNAAIPHLEAERRQLMASYAIARRRHAGQRKAAAALVKVTAAALKAELAEKSRRVRAPSLPDLFTSMEA